MGLEKNPTDAFEVYGNKLRSYYDAVLKRLELDGMVLKQDAHTEQRLLKTINDLLSRESPTPDDNKFVDVVIDNLKRLDQLIFANEPVEQSDTANETAITLEELTRNIPDTVTGEFPAIMTVLRSNIDSYSPESIQTLRRIFTNELESRMIDDPDHQADHQRILDEILSILDTKTN